LPFDVLFSDKKAMSSGLQLADLVARPIGLSVLKPGQNNVRLKCLRESFTATGGGTRSVKATKARIKNLSGRRKRKTPVKLTEAVAPTGHPQSICPKMYDGQTNIAS
jgi:hypothetical protein